MTEIETPEIVELVEPGDLPDMLEAALREEVDSVRHLDIKDYTMNGEGKTIVSGEAVYRQVKPFNFEVNVGSHKEGLVVLDPVEVVIEFTEPDYEH